MTTANIHIAAPPRFTRYELAYLLAGRDEPSAEISREAFGIPRVTEGDPVAAAGASSLVARGFLEERQDAVFPRNEAGLVGYALGTARHWVSILTRTPEGVQAVIVFQGAVMGFFVQAAPAATLDFVPVRQDTTIRQVARDVVVKLLARSDVDVMVRSVDLEQRRSLFVRVRPEGTAIGRDPVFPGDEEWPAPEVELVPATNADVESAIDEILAATSGGV